MADVKNYYRDCYYPMYMQSDSKTRKASREHWLKVHAANVASDNEALIIFSAQILAMQDLADKCLASDNEAVDF